MHSTAVTEIASHLSDDQPIPEAWFNDTSTPAQAARRALQAIGTSAALEALRNVLPTQSVAAQRTAVEADGRASS
jgi:hypothetical protein